MLDICCVPEDEPIPDILKMEQPKTKSVWDDEYADDNDMKESWEDEDEPAPVVEMWMWESRLDLFRAIHLSKGKGDWMFSYLELQMQGMDGYEATRRIREEEKNYGVHTPIIALTAHSLSEEKNKMIVMDYYLSKPLSKEQLLDAIFGIHGK